MGSLYKRGNVWWIKYHRNGKPIRESSRCSKKMVATRLLKRREGEVADGRVPGIHFDKITFDDLAKVFLRDYRINQKKSLPRAERSVEVLKIEFGGMKIIQIGTPAINEYVERRLSEKAANSTINRELSALKRMMNLGAEQTPPIVDRVPKITMLKENNTRKGFFEHAEFIRLRDNLPEHLKCLVTFAYKSGWRVSEITGLRWGQVDLDLGLVRLETGETKNDDARTVYLDEELKRMFDELWQERRKHAQILPFVFIRPDGTDRVKRFDKAWKTACNKAGVEGRLFHDFRRTAVRNMVRAGVPETVAMKISGHKTRSVFDRYNITNDADLIEASKKQETYLGSRLGTVLGTVHNLEEKRANECQR